MSKNIEFLTPVGRLVQGDPFEAQTKNMQGQPLVTQSGQPTQRYFVAVAFKKDDPDFPAFWAKAQEAAQLGFPGQNILPFWDPACRFSWKIADGDGFDDNGKPNANKEGFAGHWVVKFSSSFAPRCFHTGHYLPHEVIQDPNAIQRGYYVRVSGTIEGNEQTSKPGVYMNLSMVELILARPDLVISSGPDAAAVFGGSAPVMPAGLPAAPVGMPGAAPVGMPGAAPVGMPGAAPAFTPPAPVAAGPASQPNATGLPPTALPAASSVPMSPSNPVAPNPAFLGGPAGAPPGVPVVPPAPPAGPQMTAKAGAATYEQFVAQGWTDQAMREQGYIV